MALIAAMHRGGRHGTARTGCRRRRRRQLEEHRCLLNGQCRKVHGTDGGEQSGDQSLEFMGHHLS